MGSTSYEQFRDELLTRHTNSLTSGLSIVGDVVILASIPAGVARRSVKASTGTLVLGFLIAAVAHLFQPGTVKAEFTAIGRHPIWAFRAETKRVTRVFRSSV